MTASKDWLPQNHEGLYDQSKQTVTYLTTSANRRRMGFSSSTPQGQWLDAIFTPKYNGFVTAFDQWVNPATRTPILTERLFTAEDLFKPEYRHLYNGFLRESPLVTNDDLLAMGLPKRHTGGGIPSPIPTDHPGSRIITSEMRRLTIEFFEGDGSHRKAKPAGVHGAEIRWVVRDTEQIVHIDDLIHSSFDTHTPLTLEFADEQRGKVFYYALRWENTRGEKGPFGPIENAIIP